MNKAEPITERYKTWESFLARPESVLLTLFALSVATVAIAVGLNLHSNCAQWNFLDALKTFAILLGICGAVYQFVLRRAFESALLIDVTVSTNGYDASRVATHLQVRLKNIGNRRIRTPEELSKDQIEEYEHSIVYPCDLSVRRVTSDLPAPVGHLIPEPEFVSWWRRAAAAAHSRVPSSERPVLEEVGNHISLLEEYSDRYSKIDFFLEPNEEYYFSNLLVLPPGHYLAKIVFVGTRAAAAEYWSRIAYFHIPTIPPPKPLVGLCAEPSQ
jgi:hypothetical protein